MSKKQSDYEIAVVMGDAHCPFQDKHVCSTMTQLLVDLQPDNVFYLGDMCDFPQISHFSKSPLRKLSAAEAKAVSLEAGVLAKKAAKGKKAVELQQEIILQSVCQRDLEETYGVLRDHRKAAPNAKFKYVSGNHEHRLIMFLNEMAPQLVGLARAGEKVPVLSLPYLLRFDELDIEFIYSGTRESWFQWGGLLIGHFDKVLKCSGYTAKAIVDDRGFSIIQGHTHRLGASFKRQFDSDLAGFEAGCMCGLHPEYNAMPNWQQGFCVVHKRRGGKRFHVNLVPIVEGIFIYGDKEYGRRG